MIKKIKNIWKNNITPFFKKENEQRVSPIRFMSVCMFLVILISDITKLLYIFEIVSRDLSDTFLATVNGLFMGLCGLNVWRSNRENTDKEKTQ